MTNSACAGNVSRYMMCFTSNLNRSIISQGVASRATIAQPLALLHFNLNVGMNTSIAHMAQSNH